MHRRAAASCGFGNRLCPANVLIPPNDAGGRPIKHCIFHGRWYNLRTAVNESRKAFVAAVIAAVLMGVLGVFVKESHCSAQTCSMVRFSIGLFLVVPVFALRREGKAFSLPAAVSGVGISLCILFYFQAIQGLSVGIAALLPATGPLFAAAGEALVQRRMPPWKNGLLMLAAAAGIVLVCAPGICGGGQLEYYAYGLLSGLCYGVYILLNRLIPDKVKNLQRAFWQFVAGVVVLAVPFAMQENPFRGAETGWPYLICIGVFQGCMVMLLAAYAMKHMSAIRYGTVAYLEPTVAVALGWVVYSDHLQPLQWLGVVMVLVCSVCQSLLPNQTAAPPQDTEKQPGAGV